MVEWGVGEDKVVEGRGILVDVVEDQVDAEEEEVGSSSFDPLACYRCGVRGHLARDCPSTSGQSTGSSLTSSSSGNIRQIQAERPTAW